MDGVAYGLGVGLQATPDTARTLYLNEQRRQQAKEQRALQLRLKEDEQFNTLVNKIQTDTSNYKWHRLLVKEASLVTADAVKKMLDAKESGDYDSKNKIAKIQADLLRKKAELITLNESYYAFDNATEKVNAGGLYTTKNTRKAADAFRNATDRTDLESKMLQFGVQSDPYFVFDKDRGYVLPSLVGKIDINKSVRDAVKSVPSLVNFKYEEMSGGKNKQTTVKRQAITKADAEEALKNNPLLSTQNNFGSLEEAAEDMLSNPDFKFQFMDTYELEGKDDEEVKQSLLELMKPMAGYKASVSVKTPSKGINITNITGQENMSSAAFDPDAYDEFETTYIAPGNKSVKASVKGIGKVNTPLKWPENVKPTSAVRIDGSDVTESTLKDSNFSGITAIPYYMLNGKKVPVNSQNESKVKIAGVEMFIMLELNSGVVFIPYQKTHISSALQSGNKDEKFAVLNGTQKMKQMVDTTNKELSALPKTPAENAKWIENWKKTFQSKK